MLPAVCHVQPAEVLEQHHIDLTSPEFPSVLDISNLLKLSAAGDHVKDDREGEVHTTDPAVLNRARSLTVSSSEAQSFTFDSAQVFCLQAFPASFLSWLDSLPMNLIRYQYLRTFRLHVMFFDVYMDFKCQADTKPGCTDCELCFCVSVLLMSTNWCCRRKVKMNTLHSSWLYTLTESLISLVGAVDIIDELMSANGKQQNTCITTPSLVSEQNLFFFSWKFQIYCFHLQMSLFCVHM